jgi:hypothetical protein
MYLYMHTTRHVVLHISQFISDKMFHDSLKQVFIRLILTLSAINIYV